MILAAVLLGGAVSQAVAQTTLDLSTYEMDTFSFTLTAPSSIKTFTIGATDLTDDVIVSAPPQFEVSKDTTPADFQNSISFSTFEFLPTAPTTVLVRMKAQILPDSVSGEVINVSTYGGSFAGPITKTIALTGTLSGWTYAAWTNDADSGIDQNNYYTHKYALSGSGDVRVNGVTFTSLAGNYVTGKMSFQNIEGVAVDPTAAFTSQVAGSSAGLVSKYRTGDGSVEPMTINLSGLATNTRYELSLYSYSSSANESVLKFYAGTDEREIDTNFFGGTAVTSLEYHGNGMRVIYNYTSDGEGNAQIKIDPATISGTLESFHLGALSNRQVAAAEGDFDYTTTGGKVTINAYVGTAGGVVVIPATIGGFQVTAIGNKAFFESNVTEVFIPFGVTTIGVEAFAGCREMELISLPSSLASIGNSAFQSCDKLNNVIIPNSVISLGANAFESCRDLANVTLPSNLTLIQSGTFFACPNLATITIPGSVTEIQLHAFMNCTSLAAVYFEGKTRPTVGNNAFSGIAGVAKGYYYTGYAATWSGAAAISDLPLESYANPKEDFTYASEETCTIFTYIGTDPVVWIPPAIDGKSVAVIDEFAFIRKLQVTNVLIPPTVTEIRANAFYHCEALSNIVIPGSVIRVGSSAFSECYALS
ncbi:MAG: leucine-rich repeat protein, partial [Akkermansiaceae bacterium]|nr:leucine-rich repeat protein [Akkermansiaceae bacterium]